MASIELSFAENFRRRVWDNFDPGFVVRQLSRVGLADESRLVLFRALQAWVLKPFDSPYRYDMICMGAADVLASLEAKAARENKDISISAEFYSDILKVIGGFKGLFSSEVDVLSKHKSLRGHRHVATILSICHYQNAHLTDKKRFARPSLNRAMEAACKIELEAGGKPKSDVKLPSLQAKAAAGDKSKASVLPADLTLRGIKRLWSPLRPSSAFIYAAAAMKQPGGSFLERLLTNEKAHFVTSEELSRWLRRTRFVQETILSRLPLDYDPVDFGQMQPLPFSPAEFSAFERDLIEFFSATPKEKRRLNGSAVIR
ncbi:MAG: hypothetical protein E5Y74_08185 [Mesorhizobium sp.]|nr:MAG: hypothetical protein E5Y74_08185 [Mesorhizobium sp.]